MYETREPLSRTPSPSHTSRVLSYFNNYMLVHREIAGKMAHILFTWLLKVCLSTPEPTMVMAAVDWVFLPCLLTPKLPPTEAVLFGLFWGTDTRVTCWPPGAAVLYWV